ncbi:MAG: FtsK/SpoIIIE domain-containing protein [Planctomycetaceae bacterium]
MMPGGRTSADRLVPKVEWQLTQPQTTLHNTAPRTLRSGMATYEPLFTALHQAVAQRQKGEQVLRERFLEGPSADESALRQRLSQLQDERDQLRGQLEAVSAQERAERLASYQSQLEVVEMAHREASSEIALRFDTELAEIEQTLTDSTWVATSVLDDTADDSPKRLFDKFKTLLHKEREGQVAQWTELNNGFETLTNRYKWEARPLPEPTNPPENRDEGQERFHAAVERAEKQLQGIDRLLLPKLFLGFRPLWIFLVFTAAVGLPLYFLVQPSQLKLHVSAESPTWIIISAACAAGGVLIFELLVYTLAAMKQSDALRQLQQSVVEAGWIHEKWLAMARTELQTKTKEFETKQRIMVKQREQSLNRFESEHASLSDRLRSQRAEELRNEEQRHKSQRQRISDSRDAELARLDEKFRTHLAEQTASIEAAITEAQHQLETYLSTHERARSEHWHQLKTSWDTGWGEFDSAVRALGESSRSLFAPWEDLRPEQWTPPQGLPPAVRFGGYAVDLEQMAGLISPDMRLAPRTSQVELPALMPFPNEASLLTLFRNSAGRDAAIRMQQTIMLRLLTLFPPGKLRFTIIDPVGLGESHAGFMHLADFDEMLISGRIWTETSQIEARLADLTEHMENVLQKYLRNEFESIEDYNHHAGEVAEPYHFLVISDFPSKFSEIAARRLNSIVMSGPRCGVYTLMSADTSKQLPNNFSLSDLHTQMQTLQWKEGAFHAGGIDAKGDIARWPIVIDEPPGPEAFTRIVRMVGEASKDARRVEVSFGRIAPSVANYWSQDSRREIDIPLGRAGATKLQHLRLGKGTSQHMLIAGKTGSGKSTFLHALITNLALHYSPNEIRFYLIDFKKGVEFKQYASQHLPHAEVIAIESDREFGVSALQRLDEVLQERGELFRRHGVQDIAGFRNAVPDTPLPRILLVVDEFQEFFIEDDKLSQTASLMLDRLVRQGRAFGIHVILGSQTLGGAYSLARSTLGQVAVRVALQCSEADAHLILSEENTAARLLTRPGEAIYNDANGMLVGNHPFQIAWLPDDEREQYLKHLSSLMQQRQLPWNPPIIFEGNIPSEPSRNIPLQTIIQAAGSKRESTSSKATAAAFAAPTIWLGEAVEIKEATSFTFHREAGSHLLIVGSDSEAAYGIMATALVSLAAQFAAGHCPSSPVTVATAEVAASPTPGESSVSSPLASFYVINGSPADAPESQGWRRIVETVPQSAELIEPRDAAGVVAKLSAEQQRREQNRDVAHPPIFLFVYHLAKMRDLRKGEDDYSFGGFGTTAATTSTDPGKQFSDLLKNGPESGIHVVTWCDTASNLDRWLGRNGLKELTHRIAFQMNAADSSNLIDSPAASRLGVNRALFYREESGTSEKFRPYGPPQTDWLAWVHQTLTQASSPPLEEATDLDSFFVT